METAALLLTFFRIGCLAFGGGGSTLAMIHREFCVRRQVVSEEESQLLFGLFSRCAGHEPPCFDGAPRPPRAESSVVQALFQYNVARDRLLRAVGETAPAPAPDVGAGKKP